MPPKVIGGQERLSADVLAAIQQDFDVIDVANRRGRLSQAPYWATLGLRLRKHGRGRDAVALGSDASLCAPLAMSGQKTILRVNGLDLLFPNRAYQSMLRRYLPRIDRIVAISRGTAELAENVGVDPSRITVINPSAEAPPSWEPTPQSGRILHVGRLVPRKGVAEFIEDIWPRITKENGDASFDIVGDGPDRDRVLRAIDQAPQKERIRWHGRASDEALQQLYRTADVFIMNNQPTEHDWEGFGIVAIEAAVRGVPVVARGMEGVVDAVQDGVTGTLVEPGHNEEFAEVVAGTFSGGFLDRSQLQKRATKTYGSDRAREEYKAVVEGASISGYN